MVGMWDDFEKLGIEQVRKNLGTNVWDHNKKDVAREWLTFKAQEQAEESERRNEASRSEQMEIARSAKDAAWAAADAARDAAKSARTANKTAMIALIIAAASASGTVIGLFFR